MPDAVPLAFFSYSRQDSDFVLRLATDLRKGGAAIWVDQLDISPGQLWDKAVEQALGTCPRMLVILSPAAVDSANVMDEVSFALEEHKPVIPILYRDCKIPFRLRRVQYIDARNEYQRALQELLRMLGVGAVAGALAATVVPMPVEAEYRALSRPPFPGAPDCDRQPIERTPADVARIPLTRSEAAANAVEQPEPRPAAKAPVNSATADSRRMFMIGGAATIAMLGGGIGIWLVLQPHQERAPTPSLAPIITPPAGRSIGPRQPRVQVGADWVHQFIRAWQGPSPQELRPYFHDFVSPYFSLPSADWAAIEMDKTAYFNRFPEIQYTLVDSPRITAHDQVDAVDVVVNYETVKRDGQRMTGTVHLIMTVKSFDGAWKIVGIQERSLNR